MIIKFAKNIAIIVLEHCDLYDRGFQKREDIFDDINNLILSDKLNTMYKIHLFVDEEPITINPSTRKYILVDKFRIYGSKLNIHSFCEGTVIPGAVNTHYQEYAISDTKLVSISKRCGNVRIREYRRAE